MFKKSAGFLSFIMMACLILAPVVSADEGEIGRPHDKKDNVEQQEVE